MYWELLPRRPLIIKLSTMTLTSISIQSLAVPGVLLNICFLAFSSQLLFQFLQPGTLEKNQALFFNALIFCVLVSYARSVGTDPGADPRVKEADLAEQSLQPPAAAVPAVTTFVPWQRWCRKCEAAKPPRAHHCKSCKRFAFACPGGRKSLSLL